MANRFETASTTNDVGCRVVPLTAESTVEQVVANVTTSIGTFADSTLPLCVMVDELAALLDVGWPLASVLDLLYKVFCVHRARALLAHCRCTR